MAIELEHGSSTDVGHVRTVQEDACAGASPVFVVADGMGGHSGGDVASRIVVTEMARLGGRSFNSSTGREAVTAALLRAQARLRAYAELQASDSRAWYAGTTVVVALLLEAWDDRRVGQPRWLVAHVGDSRAYALGEQGLVQVTRDHSVVQGLVDAGQITAQEAEVHAERHVITKALSSKGVPEPDFVELTLVEAPRLLLCTDGVSGLVDERGLAAVLTTAVRPQEAAEAVVQAALSSGGTDNATALVLDVVG